MATVTRYIDTSSTAGGDGTTQSHTGATRAYASAAAWESAEQADLVSAGDIHEVYAAGTTADASVQIAGWITGASNYILFAGDPTAPDGDGINTTKVFDATSYYTIATGDVQGVEVNDNHVRVEDIQISSTPTVNNVECVEFSAVQTGSDLRLSRVRMQWNSAGGVNGDAVLINDLQANVTIENCIIEWDAGSATQYGITIVNSDTVSIFNTTIETAGIGILTAGGTITIKNNNIFLCTDDISDGGGTVTVQFNCAEDDLDTEFTESTNTILGTLSDEMVGHTTGDFTPKTGSSLIDAGTTGGPASDILGTSYGATAECGAIAFVAAGGWTGKINGITNPSKVNGIAVAGISKINGVA